MRLKYDLVVNGVRVRKDLSHQKAVDYYKLMRDAFPEDHIEIIFAESEIVKK